ncbi:MAG: prepilin peptidase [Candidatus Omnitrophota bacterium]|jgi:leader peptidase (prepilin peptidase)/N-methyltransferase
MIGKILIFIFGSAIGSFLNVCIYRLPLEQSIVKPRSFCPHCKKTIPWFDNIPLISYFILRGKCRFCKKTISFRYFLVEFITAAVFLLFYNLHGLGFDFVLYTFFVCLLIVATFVDIAHRIIPDEISLGGIVAGFLLSGIKGLNLSPFTFNYRPVLDSFLGIIIGGSIIYLTSKAFDIIYFKLLKKGPIDGETESMGGGDVKLLAMIGAFLGWKIALLTFFMAPMFGAVVGTVNLLIRKQHTIPYGPFLSLAAFINLFLADTILRLLFFI